MTTLLDLERSLLQNPFDARLRHAYAEALENAERHEDALTQWRLLCSQGESAAVWLRVALCLGALGRDDEAADAQEAAERQPDHEQARAALSPAQRAALGARAPRQPLRLVSGGAHEVPDAGEVISIHRAAKVRFADVAGMDELKKILRLRIIEPFLRPGLFQRFKRKAGGGVLLYGPPGCGKTMMAKAIATECDASFTAVGISDVLNMFVGQSEQNLAGVFDKARSERPAVLFFDELDALAYSRSKAHSDHTRTTVNEFLNQLDGMSGQNDGVLVLGATNMPWDVDEAMKRPGRFDRQVFVPPPDAQAREEIFRMKLRDVPVAELDYAALARLTENFSGADIDGVIEAAKDGALLQLLDAAEEVRIQQEDLTRAIAEAVPSTLDWLKTARNLVKFGGVGRAYKDVEQYLRQTRMY